MSVLQTLTTVHIHRLALIKHTLKRKKHYVTLCIFLFILEKVPAFTAVHLLHLNILQSSNEMKHLTNVNYVTFFRGFDHKAGDLIKRTA